MAFGFFRKKDKKKIEKDMVLSKESLPKHVGIIMDGNGRWAKKRGLPRQIGHKYGAETFREIVKHCEKLGIEIVTVYAFSTENWRRSVEEVNAIMKLLEEYLIESLLDFKEENILTRFIGNRDGLTPKIVSLIDEVEASTKDRTGMILNIAVNYGGREEITKAVKTIAKKCVDGEINPENISEETISKFLYTSDQIDPDLILRPSGEYRLSNFLVWQSAYAEFVFMDILWPDFTKEDMEDALREYARRHRRFGGV